MAPLTVEQNEALSFLFLQPVNQLSANRQARKETNIDYYEVMVYSKRCGTGTSSGNVKQSELERRLHMKREWNQYEEWK